jgi:hypothetical protein
MHEPHGWLMHDDELLPVHSTNLLQLHNSDTNVMYLNVLDCPSLQCVELLQEVLGHVMKHFSSRFTRVVPGPPQASRHYTTR